MRPSDLSSRFRLRCVLVHVQAAKSLLVASSRFVFLEFDWAVKLLLSSIAATVKELRPSHPPSHRRVRPHHDLDFASVPVLIDLLGRFMDAQSTNGENYREILLSAILQLFWTCSSDPPPPLHNQLNIILGLFCLMTRFLFDLPAFYFDPLINSSMWPATSSI